MMRALIPAYVLHRYPIGTADHRVTARTRPLPGGAWRSPTKARLHGLLQPFTPFC